jgi:hypothetical protein
MICLSINLLRWLARRPFETAGALLADWLLDKCNSTPLAPSAKANAE